MDKRRRLAQAATKYAAYQIPGIVVLILILIFIDRWVDLPVWTVWLIVGVWVGKDAVLFPFVWRAYERGHEEKDPMVGKLGTTESRLERSGYVRIGGELWQAEVRSGCPPVETGAKVRVTARQGVRVIVESEEERVDGHEKKP